MQPIQIGVYEHYKGKRYKVIGFARHSETLEMMVLYQALYESKEFDSSIPWTRPMSMFLEEVGIDGKQIPRFKYVGDI